MIDTEASWNYLTVQGSPDSYMMLSSLTAGTLLRIPAIPRLDFFVGFLMRGSYLYFHGENSGETSQTFKVGFGATGGLFFRLYKNIEMRFTYRFTENDLSGRSFMTHEVLAGVAWGFPVSRVDASPKSDPYKKIKFHYNRGREFYEGGSFQSALREFRAVRRIDPEHLEAGAYIKKISTSLDLFFRAVKMNDDGDLFGAIRLLKKCDPKMSEAGKLLVRIRGTLKKQLPALEKRMIRFYNKKQYPASISTGQRILLVDPGNRRAKLYIQRARKRYDAYRKFQ